MIAMSERAIVQVLGAFGDGRAYAKEECYPLIELLDRREYSPRKIDRLVGRYLEYGFLEMVSGKIPGHPYFRITDRGGKALDSYRNLHHANPAKGVLF